MKIKNLAYVAAIGLLIIGSGILGFLEIRTKSMIQRHDGQHPPAAPDSSPAVSIPKSTVLALLSVGVIGVLSVRRKKKIKRSSANHQKPPRTGSEDRDKAFIKLNKEYLSLQYQVTQHKFSGESPPDALMEAISNIERKVRLISRALE